MYQAKNIFYILLGLLIAMASMTEASGNAAGEWKLREVWRESEAEPLSITRDGAIYTVKVTQQDENVFRIHFKVGNSMSSSLEILEKGEQEDKIKVGFVMSTRMEPGSQEKRELEGYISTNLPRMDTMKVKGEGKELVLSSDDGARIVCEPSTESTN